MAENLMAALPTRMDPGTATPPGVTDAPVIVVTGWRDPDRVRWLPTLSTAWTDPDAIDRPVVSVQAPPAHAKVGEVLRDLQFALGKSPHVLGGTKTDEGGLDVPAAWLIARRTRDIIVNDAPHLRSAVADTLVELAAGVGARLWLIGHHNRAGALDDIVTVWDAVEWDLDRFDRHWQRPDQPPPKTTRTPPACVRTRLPSTSALTFRADCRRQLPEKQFAVLDRRYRDEYHDARDHFAGREDTSAVSHDDIAAHLRRRVRATGHPDDVVVVVRAIEAAALPFGFTVDVDLPVLLNAAERNPRPGRNRPGDMAELDAYARPAYPAACAAAMCDVPPRDIVELTVGSFDTAAGVLSTVSGPIEVPEALRPYLTAQQLVRRFAGATDDEPLLLSERGNPVRLTWVSRTVKVAEFECGIRLARPRYDRKTLTLFEWATVHGITVRDIYGSSRRRQRV